MTRRKPFRSGSVLGLILTVAGLTFASAHARATSSDDVDIGASQPAGATSFASGVYTVSGGGSGIGGTADQFHFDRGILAGNGMAVAQVTSIDCADLEAGSGVMLRKDAAPGSPFAAVFAMPRGGVAFAWRSRAGAQAQSALISNVSLPVWVKVRRDGSALTGSYSKDGIAWTRICVPRPIFLSASALAGVAVTSRNKTRLTIGTFTSVSVTPDLDPRALHTEGNHLCDRMGRRVSLRGVNIGGWLVTEGWMCGQSDYGGRFALEQLEARFGPSPARQLMDAWQDHWFTDRDFDAVKSYGFDLIRVPFSWRTLQDADGDWRRDANGGIDFSRFDWTVQEAAKRGIYVVFVYHVWPGQQKDYGAICQAGEPGRAERTQSAALWSALAKHFRGNGTVAGFDLINEPTGSNDFYAAHRAFYSAIRAQDPARMCIAEWVPTSDFPRLGWTDTMCSGHYPAGNKADFEKFLAELSQHDEYSTSMPCFAGEVKSDDSRNVMQNTRDMTREMDGLDWAWAAWTYKGVNVGGWALFDYDKSVKYDLAKDLFGSILNDWTTNLTAWQDLSRPVNYSLKTEMLTGYEDGAAYGAAEAAQQAAFASPYPPP